jgi:hypothetical protein
MSTLLFAHPPPLHAFVIHPPDGVAHIAVSYGVLNIFRCIEAHTHALVYTYASRPPMQIEFGIVQVAHGPHTPSPPLWGYMCNEGVHMIILCCVGYDVDQGCGIRVREHCSRRWRYRILLQ